MELDITATKALLVVSLAGVVVLLALITHSLMT